MECKWGTKVTDSICDGSGHYIKNSVSKCRESAINDGLCEKHSSIMQKVKMVCPEASFVQNPTRDSDNVG